MEENGGGGGGVVVVSCVNESTATVPAAAAQVGGGDRIKKPSESMKRGRSVDEEDKRDQSSKRQYQTDVNQDKTSFVIVSKITEPPPVSSYSDAHLLASMRDGSPPSLPVVNTAGVTNDRNESEEVQR